MSALLQPGTTLQRGYVIEKVIGQGGMGAVYLARQASLGGRRVALKETIISGGTPEDRERAIVQFRAEAEILASLEHPGLVDVKDYFEENGSQFLVMQFIDGANLEQLCEQRKATPPVRQAVGWILTVCDVLTFLHDHDPPVIVRDLKPSNIMLDPQGRIRLIDFGIARVFDKVNETSTFLKGAGTIGYAPLEQHGGGTTDPRSDVYAMGATAYRLLTGRMPPGAVAIATGEASLTPPSVLNPLVTPELEAVVLRMMGLRKDDRYPSAAAAGEALRKASESLTASDQAVAASVAPKFCISCGGALTAGSAACGQCGQAVETAPGAAWQVEPQHGPPSGGTAAQKGSTGSPSGGTATPPATGQTPGSGPTSAGGMAPAAGGWGPQGPPSGAQGWQSGAPPAAQGWQTPPAAPPAAQGWQTPPAAPPAAQGWQAPPAAPPAAQGWQAPAATAAQGGGWAAPQGQPGGFVPQSGLPPTSMLPPASSAPPGPHPSGGAAQPAAKSPLPMILAVVLLVAIGVGAFWFTRKPEPSQSGIASNGSPSPVSTPTPASTPAPTLAPVSTPSPAYTPAPAETPTPTPVPEEKGGGDADALALRIQQETGFSFTAPEGAGLVAKPDGELQIDKGDFFIAVTASADDIDATLEKAVSMMKRIGGDDYESDGEPKTVQEGDAKGKVQTGTVPIKGSTYEFWVCVFDKGKSVLRVAVLGKNLKSNSEFNAFMESIK